MPEKIFTLSALIVARDEAKNLPDCLDSVAWVDEIIVVVDPASQDGTETVARSLATRVIVRPFADFASQRNAALAESTCDWVLAIDADERLTPDLALEIRSRLTKQARACHGYRIPIRSVVLGRPFRFSGTQHDQPLRLFQRAKGQWVGAVHETVDLDGPVETLTGYLTHRTLPDLRTFLRKIDHYTTLQARNAHREGRRFRLIDVTVRPVWVFLKLYLGKQGFRDGLEGFGFCALSGVSTAVTHGKLRELIRAEESKRPDHRHDAFVAERFDESADRFKPDVGADDVRLRSVLEALGPIQGQRILDLGCGKGRFAAHLREAGAEVVGIDLSTSMLAAALSLDRVRASARRLPFADGTFDAVVAIEVLEHVGAVEPVLSEARRVLKPGGRLAIIDKNAGALNAKRPWLPSLLVKWIDERRGLWMYPKNGPVLERWFWPRRMKKRLRRDFAEVRVNYLLRPEEAERRVFRAIPSSRLMTLWSARGKRSDSIEVRS